MKNSPPKKSKKTSETHQLQSANEDEGAAPAAAAHCVGGVDSDSEPAEKRCREAGEPVEVPVPDRKSVV